MLLTKEVEVKPSGKTIKHYKDKGYDVRYHEPLVVKVEDLPSGSHAKVEVLCDYCNEETFLIVYYDYNKEMKYINKHACENCWQKKTEEVNMARHGVRSVSQLKEVKKKREETMRSRYGVSTPLQNKEIMQKTRETSLERYGYASPSQVPEFRERAIFTSIERYGVDCPSKSKEVKEKTRATNIERYGVSSTMQVPEVRAKANKTLCENGLVKTSAQQLYLHSLYGGEINYAISHYAIDICFPEEKLIVEYDGGGHDLRVVLGRLTQEEFDNKEMIRNIVLKREGYKRMNIVSKKDFLPSDQILLQMLQQARQYFLNYPNHSWIEFNIDTSTVRNAEYKDGVFFDFGKLRKIKKATEVA